MKWYCDEVLSTIVGKIIWRKQRGKEVISDIATVSDEAFGYLLLDNYYDFWTRKDGDDVLKPKWTDPKTGATLDQGWTEEGIHQFNKYIKRVTRHRKKDNDFEEEYMTGYEDKKRRRTNQDGSQAGVAVLDTKGANFSDGESSEEESDTSEEDNNT